MHIKRVTIHGFKSYRERTVCGDLSPGHNSIVGFNGSGKSNFFAALRFVLSEQHQNLRPEDRSKLLNEGAGASVMTAYVEIVFDNSDRRIDSEKEEVSMKRMIGLKKDEYFVDGKHVSRQDIANMLETAGFSKSNPYYIVEQGKVTIITEMKDNQRLALIKDVAGTNVYEEKKGESEKILNDSLRKMEEIKHNLGMIETRLEKLDKEKEELSQYYALDKERRSLHHAMLSKRIQVLRAKLTELDRIKQELRIDSGKDSHSYEEMEADKENLQKAVDELRKRLDAIAQEKEALEKETDEQIQAQMNKQESVNRLTKSIEQKNRGIKAKSDTIAENEKNAQKIDGERRDLEPKIQEMKKSQDKILEEFREVDRERSTLLAMQQKSEFETQASRDKHLKKEISQLEEQVSNLKSGIETARKEIVNKTNEKNECEKKVTEVDKRLKEFEQNQNERQTKKRDLRQQEGELTKKIKELQKSQWECNKNKQQHQDSLKEVERKLSNNYTLQFLDEFCKREKVKGYHGPLIDLIQCNEKYYTAVEQIGGKQMFSAVVEDDNVAARLVKALQSEKGCRMSFLPLSKLRPHKTNFPADMVDAEPLSKCIKCDDKFRVAVEQVFGSTLLCRTLEVANQYRQEHNLECVTIDGDTVRRKGAIKGGYYDNSVSKLRLNQVKQEKIKLTKELDKEEDGINKKLNQYQQEQLQLSSEERHLDNDQSKSDREKRALANEIQDLNAKIKYLTSEIAAKEKDIEENDRLQTDFQHKINQNHDRLALPFSQTITAAQLQRLEELTQRHTQLERQQKVKEQAQIVLTGKQASLEGELQRVQSELQDLKATISALQGERQSLQDDLEMEHLKLEDLVQQSKACSENSSTKEHEYVQAQRELGRKEEDLKQLKNKLKSQASEASKRKNQLGSNAADREKYQKDIEIANKQLQELGSLPEAFEKYRDKTEKNLNDSLVKVTEKLGKFKNINKKAMDQFNQFTDQKGIFQERMKELQQAENSIRKLIQNLDAKKDNALQTTFKMVAKHFSDVFKTIVPGGEGKLVMRTKDVQDDDEEEGVGAPSRKEYTGIGVEVRFAAGTSVQKMRELSGGQKCVVALTIIFAIQRCDPAPFYLFDEVDANLDPMYRGAVANMISSQKLAKEGDPNSSVQFLTSSFHEELVKAADRHWIVSHSGMSRINQGQLEDQLKIVRKNAQTAPAGAGGSAAGRR